MAQKNIDRTLLKSMNVKSFRNMQDVNFDFGERITVISGKNGTAKSTILGLVAQIFSFDKDVIKDESLSYKALNDKSFKSKFGDHFRLSDKFDKPGEMDVRYYVYDAYFKKDIPELILTMPATQDRKHRVVVRNNLPVNQGGNTSRNVTHPVIYLSLKRLLPIAEREKDTVRDISYLQDNSKDFTHYCNEIVGKIEGVNITSTKGLVDSSVVHGNNYDHQAVSTGEDNVGQIVQALFSFKKLKEDYEDYHGGLLIIDEIDAGLFPYAQNKVIDVLKKFSREFDIQIIVSTHSPIIIQNIYEKSLRDKKNFRNIFLSTVHGPLNVRSNIGWNEIYNELLVKTNKVDDNLKLPKVNIYFEDGEAIEFFKRLIVKNKVKRVLNILTNVSMGCKMYDSLIRSGVPEFTEKSILVLDGDVIKNKKAMKYKNVALLPTSQPPDRILFHFLFALDRSDDFWKNDIQFTKDTLISCTNVQDIVSRLGINENTSFKEFIGLVDKDLENKSTSGLRDLFKEFYKDEQIQNLLSKVSTNPFEYYLRLNPSIRTEFETQFVDKLKYVLTKGLGAPQTEVYKYLSV